MATQTTNLNLTKPNINELYNVGVFNENFDKIDGAIGQKLSSLPSAMYNGGSPSTMIGTASVFQGVSAFSGYTAQHTITEPKCFSADPNGFKVLKSGTYLLLLHAHYNTSVSSVQMATQFYNYTKSAGVGSNMYNCNPTTWGLLSNHAIAHLDADDIIMVRFQKYSTATADWKPSSVRFSIFLLKDDAMENGVNAPGDLENVVTEKLLWTNPNPASGFAAQTVNLNLNNNTSIEEYDTIRVTFIDQASDLTYRFVEVPATIGNMGVANAIWNLSSTSNIYFVRRAFTLAETSITFKTGEYKSGGAMTTSNSTSNYIIPQKIYGIKKVTALDKGAILDDYVIERGTDGIWMWEKWNSGKAVCYGSYEDATITTGYISFAYPTNLFVDASKMYQFTTARYGSSDNRQPRVYFITDSASIENYTIYLRNASGGIPTGTFSAGVHTVGRWK